jgi:glucosamine-6-phosphate deaminase
VKWIVVDDYEDLSTHAAQLMLDRVATNPGLVLGLPTGRTPVGMYAHVVAACERKYHCFRDVRTFNLDEYVGIPPDHPGSYFSYMKHHLFDHVDLQRENIHIPDGMAARVRAERSDLPFEQALALECEHYEEELREAGSLDLTFLGLGRNGHIGFNEPGTPFDSRTHVIRLSESTRVANADLFADGNVPERAITMGIGTILESRAIVVMASGGSKANTVALLAQTGPSSDFPASALKAHHDVTVLVDRAAAGDGRGIEFASTGG